MSGAENTSSRAKGALRHLVDDAVGLGIIGCRVGHTAVDIAHQAWDHSIQIDDAWVPASHTARVFMVDLPVEGGTVGSRLHGNPMYAGRTLGFFHGEFGAIMVGSAYAALDAGKVQAADVLSTDPPLGKPSKYTVLADPKHIGGFQNVAPIAKTSVVKDGGADFTKTVNAGSALLSAKLVRNSVLKIYRGGSHALGDTDRDKLNADLLAFVRS